MVSVRSTRIFFRKGRCRCRIRLIGGVRFANASHFLGPGQGSALLFREQVGSLMPDWHENDGIDRHAFLEEVTRVDVDAMGAAVDLRDPQEHQVDKTVWLAALCLS